jgi:hypothetical protein
MTHMTHMTHMTTEIKYTGKKRGQAIHLSTRFAINCPPPIMINGGKM